MAKESRGAGEAKDDVRLEAWRALLLAHDSAVRAIEADLRRTGTIPLAWYDVLLELRAARAGAVGRRTVSGADGGGGDRRGGDGGDGGGDRGDGGDGGGDAGDGGLRMQDVSDRVVLSRTRVSRLVDEMAAVGLVEKRQSTGDKRVNWASITDDGMRALERTAPAYRRSIERYFAAYVSEDEARVIADVLHRVARGDGVDMEWKPRRA